MSGNTTDYNKRTCIICGCHTSQTINIYEPRSGPNIVQLIQARFKFQPLNDDKYLCYNCNNWLINWHSLQALNSNNADNNSSGSFRSSNLNNTKPEMSSTVEVNMMITQCSKPVAIIRPRIRQESNSLLKDEAYSINEKNIQSKSGLLDGKWGKINQRKFIPRRRAIRKPLAASSCSTDKNPFTCSDIKLNICCREEFQSTQKSVSKNSSCSLVNRTPSPTVPKNLPPVTLPYLPRKSQKTIIDGKVVSMLRRIGTTLSRDHQCTPDKYQPSAEKLTNNTQALRRDIADDEILINFNTTISEVLSYNEIKSSYDVINTISDTIMDAISDYEEYSKDPPSLCETNVNSKISLQQVFRLVPKGLSVSLIEDSDVIVHEI